MAVILGYRSVDGYHKLVRCESTPLAKLSRFASISGISLSRIAAYFDDVRQRRRAA
jgi:hypothetical protein